MEGIPLADILNMLGGKKDPLGPIGQKLVDAAQKMSDALTKIQHIPAVFGRPERVSVGVLQDVEGCLLEAAHAVAEARLTREREIEKEKEAGPKVSGKH